MASIRIGNLAALKLGETLFWTRPGRQGPLLLSIQPDDVKNDQPIEFELPDESAQLIARHLDRYRPLLFDDLGDRHIRVNIAEFTLRGWSGGRPVIKHEIIVGRSYRKTPVFSGMMSYIVFNPWWETPPSIAQLDKLPMFRTDPGEIQRLGFEVLDRAGGGIDPATVDWWKIDTKDFPFRLRQRPGEVNALGQVPTPVRICTTLNPPLPYLVSEYRSQPVPPRPHRASRKLILTVPPSHVGTDEYLFT